MEVLNLGATVAAYTVTMTPTQLAQFTGTNVVDGTDDVVALSTFGTVTAQPTLLRYTLANGGANAFTANTGTLSISVTGGNTASTYNFRTTLDGNDTITGTAGSDSLTITGSGIGSATVTAIETINFTTSTASQTFATGALALPASGTITAAASTVGVSIDATALDLTTSGTIIDGPGNDTITATVSNLERKLETISLASGGSDTVVLTDSAHMVDFSASNPLTITSATSATVAQASHPYIVGDSVAITAGTTYDVFAAGTTGTYTVATVPNANSFTVTLSAATAGAAGGGTVTVVGQNRSDFVTITNFTSGIGVGSDKLSLITGSQAATGYTVITAAAQAVNKDIQNNNVFEINNSVGVVTDFTACAAGGAVETLLQNAIGVLSSTGTAGATGWLIVYGGGAQAGNAGIYSFNTSAATTVDVTAANSTVELVAVLTNIVADSLVSSNFI